MERMKLFLFPYAGGAALTYLSWKKYFPDWIELCPVELAGRGKRMGEPFYDSVDAALDDVFPKLQTGINDGPYAVYGHSMGTILGYEFIRRIRMNRLPEPVHAFFSGRYPPFIHCDSQNYLLSDAEFVQCIHQFGSLSEQILTNRELMALILPIIRADYRMVELYRKTADGFALNCPITVLNGDADQNVTREKIKRWQECTWSTCTFHEFPGGHFFINPFKAQVAKIIEDTLAE